MVGWHHRLNGHKCEQTPEDSSKQESLFGLLILLLFLPFLLLFLFLVLPLSLAFKSYKRSYKDMYWKDLFGSITPPLPVDILHDCR